jgi:hypothetical protein
MNRVPKASFFRYSKNTLHFLYCRFGHSGILVSGLRRKKKCIRCSEGDGESAPKQDDTPLEDDVMSGNYEHANTSGSKSEGPGEKLPVANTTFGALVNIETTKDASTSGQSTSSAIPPVTLGNPTATT